MPCAKQKKDSVILKHSNMDVLKDFESNNGEVQRLKDKRKQKIIEKKRKEKELK